MKKALFLTTVVLASASLYACSSSKLESQTPAGSQQPVQTTLAAEAVGATKAPETDDASKEAVNKVVTEFGKKLQEVSLLAPQDTLSKSMQDNYGALVSPSLLEKWQKDPQNAPGRAVSSPWPDHIEILSTEKLSEESYEVKGEIIEITSVEKEKGGFAAKRPITLVVKKTDGRWLIDDVTLGAYQNQNAIVYKNEKYGFNFTLPESWKNYSIIEGQWEGTPAGESSDQKAPVKGPEISIRHPQWTSEKPRQDIPILIFTLAQWDAMQKDEFHIGAAPINPTELGRNSTYVFALPARYNFAFPEGYEEVEDILKGNPLQPFDVGGGSGK